jgi:hypothetical protein
MVNLISLNRNRNHSRIKNQQKILLKNVVETVVEVELQQVVHLVVVVQLVEEILVVQLQQVQ